MSVLACLLREAGAEAALGYGGAGRGARPERTFHTTPALEGEAPHLADVRSEPSFDEMLPCPFPLLSPARPGFARFN